MCVRQEIYLRRGDCACPFGYVTSELGGSDATLVVVAASNVVIWMWLEQRDGARGIAAASFRTAKSPIVLFVGKSLPTLGDVAMKEESVHYKRPWYCTLSSLDHLTCTAQCPPLLNMFFIWRHPSRFSRLRMGPYREPLSILFRS